MYGTHPDERDDNTKSLIEGTTYLGRLLIAFSIVTTSKPQLQVVQGNAINEPFTENF